MDVTPSGNGFGEIYTSTSSTQFYGPTAALAFLTELRSRARALQTRFKHTREGRPNQSYSPSLSIDNLLHEEAAIGSETLPLKPPIPQLFDYPSYKR